MSPLAFTQPWHFGMPRARSSLTLKQLESVDSLWKRVRDITRTCSQMHRTDKYSEHSSIIWLVWPNGWEFVWELSGSRYYSSCSHITLRFGACFEQEVPWHSDNYRVCIHSETCTWHDKNVQSFWPPVSDPQERKGFCFVFPGILAYFWPLVTMPHNLLLSVGVTHIIKVIIIMQF